MEGVAVVDDASFAREVLAAPGLVMVDVSTEWCPPCKALAPHVEAIAREYAGRLKVVAMDADRSPATASALNVRGFPTLLLLRDGREVARQLGAVSRVRLAKWVDAQLAAEGVDAGSAHG